VGGAGGCILWRAGRHGQQTEKRFTIHNRHIRHNRWLILAAGCLIQTVLGGIYAWSTFVPYLVKDVGLSSGQCGFIFGLTILMFTTAMIGAGRILVHKGPRFTAMISAILFSTGYLLAPQTAGSFTGLLLCLGLLTGSGIGFGYVCPLSVGMKWFPDRKGLVTGVAVAGFGAGAIILASVAEHLLLEGVHVLRLFRWIGASSGILIVAAALLLRDPRGTTGSTSSQGHLSAILTWPFALTTIGIFSGTFAGLLIIANLTPIVLKAGLSEAQAALAVSIFALGNGTGRIAWGKLFDHFHYTSIPMSLASLALASGFLLLPLSSGAMVLVVFFVGLGFGANFVIYAAAISRYFGTGLFPRLYPICFMAYGLAGVIGPGLGGWLADATGTYHMALYICIALLALAGGISALKAHVFKT
jgi:OFA family oxalate/formate antiporter-like MFS transporter